ncbi:transmembrane family [Leptolyngbya sp. Heron Island J]|uniref:cyanoexosortase C n=1 Tax=Leptolyngbya sp. Heron Island J TaxID=1385935 RepID=UPI0003B97F50|nr:cyanoexosortase C [Leptolyngbya sp. Heron Island J]ESA34073.1 transmembrane family [Leptolyngbya sp. Heron Island J]
MNSVKQVSQDGIEYLQILLKTHHGRIVLLGLTVGLIYFPLWAYDLVIRSISGSTGLALISCATLMALVPLWKKRQQLVQLAASEEDQAIGHLLILGSVAIFPFFRSEMWAQALIWLFILIGIALSTWGAGFFAQNPLTTLLMPMTVYTRPGILAQGAWRFVMPPHFLENIMASVSTKMLQLLGQPAMVEGRFITMPTGGAVEVAWRCNGFNMAVAMAVTGLLLGIFFKRTRLQIVRLMLLGAVVGLVFNVPRVMLMAMAYAYWGEWWFDFWHGSWGAQIFVGVLFTVYYYVAMAILNRQKHSFKKA